MHSSLPKVLHPVAGLPMILYAVQAAQEVTGETPVIVIGHGADAVREAISPTAEFAIQPEQLGTAHAVQCAESLVRGKCDLVLVTYGDMPLVTTATLRRLIDTQQANPGPVTMTTLISADSRGFGRVVRGADGAVTGIVEEAQATAEQLAIHELNAGIYCFKSDWLWTALSRVQVSPKGEYYLTDVVGIAVQDGLAVQAVPLTDPDEALGINNRVHLAEAEKIGRRRINQAWMLAGVTLIDPGTVYIDATVALSPDTVIWPNTYLQGNTRVGAGCTLGPNTILRDTSVGQRCVILSSLLENAQVEDDVDMGPFGHLRPGAHLGQGVHMGNFGEVKNSYLGPKTKMGHFSYIGDAQIGENVNIGCGTITCNFSAEGKKNKTVIGDNAFIGSDTMLVAPINIGAGAITGSGSVVTHDVPEHTVVVGVPARPLRKQE
jgi:bifunctional UDP-N-acetylglucosamine pyrophosphorylase/glucosamine-1-phosphate N-acetyltransferase